MDDKKCEEGGERKGVDTDRKDQEIDNGKVGWKMISVCVCEREEERQIDGWEGQ